MSTDPLHNAIRPRDEVRELVEATQEPCRRCGEAIFVAVGHAGRRLPFDLKTAEDQEIYIGPLGQGKQGLVAGSRAPIHHCPTAPKREISFGFPRDELPDPPPYDGY